MRILYILIISIFLSGIGVAPLNAASEYTGSITAGDGGGQGVLAAPSVTTNAASSISTSGATLNGNLTGLGDYSAAVVSFEWGTTDSYGQENSAGAKTSTGVFNVSLSGLSANTTYHFRTKVTAGSSVIYGSDLSFTTSSAGGGPGGGNPGGGGGGTTPPSTEEKADKASSTEEYFESDDGTKVSSSITTQRSGGVAYETTIETTIIPVANASNTQIITLDTSEVSDVNGVSVTLSPEAINSLTGLYGMDKNIIIAITAHEAGFDQKTHDARKGFFLLGFDVFTVSLSIGGVYPEVLLSPAVISFDLTNTQHKDKLYINYYNSILRQWGSAEGGGTLTGDILSVNLNHFGDFGLMREMIESSTEEIANNRDMQWQQILADANIVYRSGTDMTVIISYNNVAQDSVAQQQGMFNYTDKLIEGTTGLTVNNVYAINNFIVYGTKSTRILGAGERAGVVNSYKKAFNKLPVSENEWKDCIAIGNGRWPGERSSEAETKAHEEFRTIYLRDANMEQPNDNAAVTVMAYGLRPSDRNMDSEKAAIKIFKGIYKYNPVSALDWDIVRAIAYSGAVR